MLTTLPSSTELLLYTTTTRATTTTTTTTTTTLHQDYSPSTTVVFLAFLNVVLSFIPVALHFRVWLLCHTPSSNLNEKLYLVNMSALEISYCLMQNVIGVMYAYMPTSAVRQYISITAHAIGFSWCHVMVALTMDRFLKVFLNIKYHLYVRKRTTRIIILFCYVVGISNVAIILSAPGEVAHKLHILHVYLYAVYSAMIILTFGVTYIYIYVKIRKRRQQELHLNNIMKRMNRVAPFSDKMQKTASKLQRKATSKLRRRTTFVPFWIMLTFILFILLPTSVEVALMDVAVSQTIRDIAYQVVSLLWLVNFTVDGLIYILAHHLIKRKLMRIIGIAGGQDVESTVATASVARSTRLSSLVGYSTLRDPLAIHELPSTRISSFVQQSSLVNTSVSGFKLATSAVGRSILANSMVTVPTLPVRSQRRGDSGLIDTLVIEELTT